MSGPGEKQQRSKEEGPAPGQVPDQKATTGTHTKTATEFASRTQHTRRRATMRDCSAQNEESNIRLVPNMIEANL